MDAASPDNTAASLVTAVGGDVYQEQVLDVDTAVVVAVAAAADIGAVGIDSLLACNADCAGGALGCSFFLIFWFQMLSDISDHSFPY